MVRTEIAPIALMRSIVAASTSEDTTMSPSTGNAGVASAVSISRVSWVSGCNSV